MFRTIKNQDYFFRVSCADWEYMCLSKDHISASIEAIKKMVNEKGGDLNLSFTIIVDKIKDTSVKREFFYTPNILADAGFQRLAKDFSDLSDFFLDRRAERH